jgi:ABC-type transporter Mla subunit MlaD
MIIKKSLVFIFLIFLITSCSNNGKYINIKFQTVNGLKEQNLVFISGVYIGEVESIKLEEDSIMVKINIEKDIELPIDSRFKIVDLDILGNKAIEIKPGISFEKIRNEEIVTGIVEESTLNLDIDKMMEQFLNPNSKQDSILLELRKLNKNIEKLIQKIN